MTAVFRNIHDRRTLLFVTWYYVISFLSWVLYDSVGTVVCAALVATCAYFSFLCSVITHNTIHCPIFHQRWLNQIMQIVLTLSYGHPVSAYVPGHNLSHHRHTQTKKDVMRTTKLRFRVNLFNLVLFMATVAKDIMRADISFMMAMRKRNPLWFLQMAFEWAMLIGGMAFLFWQDWTKTLLFVIVPHQFAAWGIVTMNYLQHDGCDQSSPVNHARNFTGATINWWTFNNGFHAIHHIEPTMHWSELPVAHAKLVQGKNHPSLNQRSLPSYLYSAFVSPGKRVMYDGSPVVLPVEGPDEEWIPKPGEAEADLGAMGNYGK